MFIERAFGGTPPSTAFRSLGPCSSRDGGAGAFALGGRRAGRL